MLIHKITPPIEYNYWLKRLDTKFNEQTIQNQKKVPELAEQTNKKTLFYYKAFGTSVINQEGRVHWAVY